MKNWTITRKCTEMHGGFYPERHFESLSEININICLYEKYPSKKAANSAIDKIVKRIFPDGIEKINGDIN